MPHESICFIIVSWNTRELTERCVGSINHHAPDSEVVVVDNASEDGTIEALRALDPPPIIVESATNIGFGPANNLGAHKCTRPVLCFINSDAYLEEPVDGLADRLATESDLGAVGPRVTFGDGRYQVSCGREFGVVGELQFCLIDGVCPIKSPAYYRREHHEARRWSEPRPVDWVSGCCLFMRRDWFERVGGWDPRYFAYCEDTALCRSVLRAGGRVEYDPSVSVVHESGASFRRAPSVNFLFYRTQSTILYLFDDPDRPAARRFLRVVSAGWLTWSWLMWPGRLIPGKSGQWFKRKQAYFRELRTRLDPAIHL